MLPHLAILQLWGNNLTGPLPPSIYNCSRLKHLDMSDNKLSGKLRIDFAKLRDISVISLGGNIFGTKYQDVEMKFIDSLKNCTKLKRLSLYNCKFQGVLPTSIGNLSNQLDYLSLEENQLHGNIPSSVGNLVGLEMLSLNGNQFIGKIPSTIGNLQKLNVLYLSENQLSGQIPYAIGNLSMLISLYLGFNKLEGRIPSTLGSCHNLLALYLNDNKLNGEIPKKILQLSSLSITLDLSQNSLFGGVIPASLASLRGLVEFDISDNDLSGNIPLFLEYYPLKYVNLSFNDYDGEVQLPNASVFSVLGNSKLCSDFVELGLPKCKKIRKQKHTKKFPLFVIVILIPSTLFIIISLAYASLKKKKKSKRQLSELSMMDGFLKVSYSQLLKATNGFSEANLIGNGGFSSVYKGILDEDEYRYVAVKVLYLQNRVAERSFMRECEAWRIIRHRNLLKIITSCSSVDFQGNDFKALVYDFMPNGNLHDWLHSVESTCKLNLFQITNILTDVACALDYIDNHCIPMIVHGDLKPSNILLDEDMVVHVGDFGLARFIGTSYQNSSTGITGTIGYVAPEYGLGNEMTNSGDVYSFGILLLEAITGKKPTDDIFDECLNLHKFASMALPDHVTNVVDVNFVNVYQKDEIVMQDKEANEKVINECLASIVKIGVSCSLDSPQQRMDIKKVVHELQHISDTLQNIHYFKIMCTFFQI